LGQLTIFLYSASLFIRDVLFIRNEVGPDNVADEDLLEGGVADNTSVTVLVDISLKHAWVAEVEPNKGTVRKGC